VVGDSEIMVHQVLNTINCVSSHLSSYNQEVWQLISHFQDSNIISIPRMCNATADALANVADRMLPLQDVFSIEILYKPFFLDNITKLHIFYDGQ